MEELLYPLLKVPFEKANKSFRLFHKHVSREIAAMQKTVSALQADQPPAQHARMDETIESLESLAERIRTAQHDTKQFIAEQQKDITSCTLRAQYVHKYQMAGDGLAASAHAAARSTSGPASISSLFTKNEQQSTENDRLIADYLLSKGYIKSSKLIQETKAIAWCAENASRLRRLSSQLEFQLRLQEFVELVRSDKKLEAIQYAQSNLTPISSQHEDDAVRKIMMESIQEAMATLAYKSPEACGVESYSRLFSVDRWETLKISFRTTFCLVYGIHSPPALCIALHAGLSSLHTRTCRRNRDAMIESRKRRLETTSESKASEDDSSSSTKASRECSELKRQSESESASQLSKKSKVARTGDIVAKSDKTDQSTLSDDENPPLCPMCSDIGGKLCSGLPFAHHPHSRLVCRVTQDVMDEHNPPVALPNGYVFSKRAIQQLTAGDDNIVTCPVTQDKYSASVLKPVFIL